MQKESVYPCVLPENVIYLQKVLYVMMAVPRTQTAFRLKDSLLERMKWRAKRENKSLNALVEEILEKKFGEELVFPKLPPEWFEENRALAEQFVIKDAKLSERYKGLDAAEQAALDKELKYEYLVEKYGK